MDDKRHQKPKWLPDVIAQVRSELGRLSESEQQQGPALKAEHEALARNKKGWAQSLANPDLPTSLRTEIEIECATAGERMQEIENLLSEDACRHQAGEDLVDEDSILNRIERLSQVLAEHNPTLGNLELSLHIDKIVCAPDGSVTVRTCKLGALTGAIELLADDDVGEFENAEGNNNSHPKHQVNRRRRGRLRVTDADDSHVDMRALADFVADPHRFAGLGDEWFWEDQFIIPETTWPFQEMAIAVATDRLAGLTHEQLASQYDVTTPTIRKALKYAEEKLDIDLSALPQKMPRSRWHEDHAAEVAELKAAEGLSTQQLVERFGKSDTTIRAALTHASQLKNGGADA